MRIHAGLMTQNELTDLVLNVTNILPYVDSVTIIDGGSVDGTIIHMRNWSREEPKIRFYIHPWQDNFPAQRNNYLKHICEIAEPGDWILAFDPDEFLDQEACENLHLLASMADNAGFNMVGFKCRSVSYRGPARVWSSEDDYWKRFLIKWSPTVRYGHDGGGTVHERVDGLAHNIYDTGKGMGFPALFYEHRKQENVIFWRGARNYFAGGGGPNLSYKNPFWVELRTWCAENLGIPFEPGTRAGWAPFLAYLIAGNIDPWLKNWMIAHRHDTWKEHAWTSNGDGASEQREFYKMYFRILHPEQEPEELRGEHIP